MFDSVSEKSDRHRTLHYGKNIKILI